MKLRTKLMGGYIIILLLMLVNGMMGVHTFFNIKHHLENTQERNIKLDRVLDDVISQILFINSDSLLYMYTGSIGEMNRYESDITDSVSSIETDLDTLENMFGNKIITDKLVEFRTALLTYVEIINEQVLFPGRKNFNDDAIELVKKMGDADTAIHDVMAKYNDFHNVIDRKTRGELKISEQILLKDFYIFLTVLFFPLVSGLFFAIKQSFLISAAVNSISKAANCVAAGDINQVVVVKTGDEIESMANSFNTMTGNMKKMIGELQQEIVRRAGAEEEAKLAYAELKRVQEQLLRKSEEKHRLFFENAPVGIIYYNEKGTITNVNNAISAIYGSSCDRLIGIDIEDNPDKEFSKEFYKTLKGETGHYEGLYRLCTSAKEVHIKADWFPLIDDGLLVGGVGIIEDITESKLMEKQFLKAQKMEAIGELTGGIAHDFNNNLSVIKGYTELTMLHTDEADPLYIALTKIRSASVKAANIIRQLLIFSHKQPIINLTVLNLNMIIDDFLKMIHRLIGEDITIKSCLEPELWKIRADAGNIEQAIMNLTINARDAMPDGGIVTIMTENVTLNEEDTRLIPYSLSGKFVCLSVEDAGIGMDFETIEHIFEPFFTTKEAGKGTGLGMSVIYGVVKEHGGWINTYSDLGSGTTFKIYFPTSSDTLKDKTEEDFSLKKLQGKGERILLIEDEDDVRDIASAILAANGYVIFRAHNAKSAMDIFLEENGNFHLIFCDVVLPDENGIQLTDHLLHQNSEIKILMSSGYIGNKAQMNSITEKKYPFLQKPYLLSDLLMAVKDALK